MLALLTAEQFIEQRYDLPDAGQWAELVEGVPTFLQPPGLEHGNVVLNLSKALAQYTQENHAGYACFDLGLAVLRRPDTVRFPAVSYFLSGPRFAESDRPFTDTPPVLIVELASTNDRRKGMASRILEYQEFGVPHVWVVDPHNRCVHVCHRGAAATRTDDVETLIGEPPLAGFSLPVAELFATPEWWNG
ncbi:MAG: Uma2 family endonuclease [Planctomyces sp.]|nr:Uma2 family endonuclease [Planctomyces sp.]